MVVLIGRVANGSPIRCSYTLGMDLGALLLGEGWSGIMKYE